MGRELSTTAFRNPRPETSRTAATSTMNPCTRGPTHKALLLLRSRCELALSLSGGTYQGNGKAQDDYDDDNAIPRKLVTMGGKFGGRERENEYEANTQPNACHTR